MKAIKHFKYLAFSTLLLYACGSKQEKVEQQSDLIEISSQQFATDTMQLGEIETKTFEIKIKCSGSIVSQPNGMAKVSAPVSAVVKTINCREGQLVEKNQVLLELSGNEIIDIQKDFAEASALHKRLKNEYERIKSLYNEKVSSQKEYITAESEYKASLAKYHGLKMKVEALSFSISKIENGVFYASYPIRAPIRGYISSLKAHIGSYFDSQSELIEIVDPALFQLKLHVFAADLPYLKKGQKVWFKPAGSDRKATAILNSTGLTVDENTKSIDCYATITGDTPENFIVNEYVEAEIITKSDTVKALPSNAIIRYETANFILVLDKQEKDKYLLKKTEVTIGRQLEGYTEILKPDIKAKIITKGVYNISL